MSDSKTTKFILAIDHGTSGAKTAIISTSGEVIDWVFEEVPLYLSEGGGAEQDPAEWWRAIMNTAKKLLEKKSVPTEDIVGICNTSQWSGTVPVDEKGNHLMNCITWMDTRGAPYMRELHKGLIQVSGYNARKMLSFIKRTAGGPTSSGKDPIAHVLYIKDKHPEIYDKTYMFLEPQDYINLKLTGKFASSYATIHMLWALDIRDINNMKLSKKLLKMMKVDAEKFPTDLRWSTDVLGPIKKELADELGLSPDVKVVIGAPDLHSATIGSGAVNNYEGHICIGTSDWLLCHVPHKKTDAIHNMASAPSAIKGRYMIINEQEIAGGTLSFLRDNLLYHTDELLMEEYAEELDDAFHKLIDEIKEMENLGEKDYNFIKGRLLHYKSELLSNPEITDVHKAFDVIEEDLAKEYKIKGETLEYLKTQFVQYKNDVLREAPLKNIYKLFDRIVEKTPAGSNNLIFTPWLYGERSPVDDHSIRGGLFNMSLDTTRAHLIRAIFEGVAFNVKWLLIYVEKFIKKWVIKENPEMKNADKIMPALNIIGGGGRSDVWCQIFADVLDRTIKQVKDPIQANARGAAIMASVGLGYMDWDDVAKHVEFSNVFTPNPENREIYDKLFEEYVNIYKVSRKICKRLNEHD